MLYSIIDVETTGFPKNKITDISIFTTDGNKIIKEFHSLVNPGISIPYFITRLTGISDDTVQNSPFFFQIAKEVIEATRDSIFVAHNVNFDFNVIKQEYKELGYIFKRKKLCTVKLSRKIFPGHRSYSLGKICADLKIPIHQRHRAKGDAKATFELFKLLYKTSNTKIFSTEVYRKQLTVSTLLNEQDIDKLPNKTGVYYFWNENNQIIYIGKSIKIRERVISHFRDTAKKEIKLCSQTSNITYKLTGSDLIAQLKESAEIKEYQPLYNRRQRRSGETYALTYFTNEKGIIELKIDYLKLVTDPLMTFESGKNAKEYLKKIVELNEFCMNYCSLEKTNGSCFYFQIKKCQGVCCGKESPANYNKRVLKYFLTIRNNKIEKSIFTKGRNEKEFGFILIEKGYYQGYGYAPKDTRKNDLKTLRENLVIQKDTRDARRIISSFHKSNAN